MKIYSPTQTDVFSFCPQARQFYKEGWAPRIADKPMIASWMGVAMGAGLEGYYTDKASPYVEKGLKAWEGSVETFRKAGGTIEESDLLGIPELLTRALTKYPKMDPIPPTWTVLGVEQAFPEYGNARMDLTVRLESGKISAVDFKWKKALYVKSGEGIAQARGRTLMEYENYWNMLHYVWTLKKVYGVGAANEYYIILGELSPGAHVTMQKFMVDPRVLATWEYDAHALWSEMQAADHVGTLEPRGNTTHRNQYGLCKYYDACFTHFLDRESMRLKYVQIERSTSR